MSTELTAEQIAQRIEVAKRAIWEADGHASMSKGERGLLTLDCYLGARVPQSHWPESALRDVINCYRHFKTGKPSFLWIDDAWNEPAPNTLGEAFGVPDWKGGQKSALKRRRMAMVEGQLAALYAGRNPPSKDKEGDKDAAERLRVAYGYSVSPNEVEAFRNKHRERLPGRYKKQSPPAT